MAHTKTLIWDIKNYNPRIITTSLQKNIKHFIKPLIYSLTHLMLPSMFKIVPVEQITDTMQILKYIIFTVRLL